MPNLTTPTLVTTVALVAAQSTAFGREIHRISNVVDALWLAYGDYSFNTGPIHALTLNPANDTITDEATFHTEETWHYRPFSGVTYAGYMDPQGGDADFANGQYASNDGTGWTIHTNVTPVPVHVMDVMVTAEGIFLFGASNGPVAPGGATVWHSADGGTTWDVSLAPRPDVSGFSRFYAAVVLNGDLHTVLDDGASGYHVYRRTAGVWSQPEDITSAVSGLVPFTIGGVNFALIIPQAKQEGISSSGATAVLTTIEDAASRGPLLAALPTSVRDAQVYGGVLYLLDVNYTLWRVDSAGTRTALLTSTVPVTCLAVTGTTVYFGTTDSKIYKTPLPA